MSSAEEVLRRALETGIYTKYGSVRQFRTDTPEGRKALEFLERADWDWNRAIALARQEGEDE